MEKQKIQLAKINKKIAKLEVKRAKILNKLEKQKANIENILLNY